jgi:hypothetical protein
VQQLRPGLVRAPVADENLARHKAPRCHGVPQLASASAIPANRATTARGMITNQACPEVGRVGVWVSTMPLDLGFAHFPTAD